MVTRRQHYVWRHYLAKWKNANNLVWCLRNGRIFQTNPINIMVERDFYRLHLLTKTDIFILQKVMVEQTSPHLRELHKDLLRKFTAIAQINEWLKSHPRATDAEKAYASKLVIEAEEMLHAGAEADFIPIMDSILAKDTKLLCSDEKSMYLFYFISMQYFRTKNMRNKIERVNKEILPAANIHRLTNLICHFAAINVGGSLYCDRRDFEIIYLECSKDTKFITGDQPVVNVFANNDGTPPDKLVFYYPVSPCLGMLLAEKEMQLGELPTTFGTTELNELNDLIAWNADSTLVASSRAQLERYQSRTNGPPSVPPSFFSRTRSTE